MILYNRGEPFLHKDILSMIRYAHERRLATAISSNLTILPDGGGKAVVQSGLDDLVVSCDGLTQETYETYRRGGNLERVLSNSLCSVIMNMRYRRLQSLPEIPAQTLQGL